VWWEKMGDVVPNFVEILKNLNLDGEVIGKMESLPKLSIIVIGKTGVGKSTLLNAVFGEELALTGIGKPITQHCREYTHSNSPIHIYDSIGIEAGMREDEYNEFFDVIKRQNNSSNKDDYIHICWYCVQEVGGRLEPIEVKIIEKIQGQIPIIVTVTKSVGGSTTQAFVDEIQKMLSSLGNIRE
jgi:predicted GTPase